MSLFYFGRSEEIEMSEPATKAMSAMEAALRNCCESKVSFRGFNLPEKGLTLRSVKIEDGVPRLIFDAADSSELVTITEEEIAAAVRLVVEGERPEFFYIGIPPGHPFYGRQYKHYVQEWLRGTAFGKTLEEVDWLMKCLTIGTKTNDARTRFWAASNTTNLEGRLGTCMDFPSDRSSGSVKMSCKSVKVEETENELIFIGNSESMLQIINDTSPLYSKYITAVLDSIAHYDVPQFLKMKEYIKLILAMEFVIKDRGVQFDREWFMGLTNTPNKNRSASQAIEVPGSEVPDVNFEALLDSLSPTQTDTEMEVTKKAKSGVKFTKKSGTSKSTCTVAVSINDYDMLYDEFDPQEPLGFDDDGSIVPAVDSWSELYRETVPWPRVWIFPSAGLAGVRSLQTAGGGVTTKHIPTARVPVGTSSKYTPRMKPEGVKRKGPYEYSNGLLSVSSSNVPQSTTTSAACPPPSDMIPKCEKPHAPIRNVGPHGKSRNGTVAKSSPRREMYGYQDKGSVQMFDEYGKKSGQLESMKIATRERDANGGEVQRGFVHIPMIGNGGGGPPHLLNDGSSDLGDDGCFSPSDCGDRLPFCSPIGSGDEMD